ncbi:MAG: hypothetical protein M5R42_14970 [Rhodocyclaceae bacterium]|nr:hypothetical protein [Rhodocyclaceae bacterium]
MNHANGTSLPVDTADARACAALIATLPLTNAREAHQTLVMLLTGLAHRPPAAAAYLDLLETLRSPLAFLQDAIAQRYASRPLPPTPTEAEAFRQVLALWQAMARAYAQVAQLGSSDPQIQNRLALICQRCVHYAGKGHPRVLPCPPRALAGRLDRPAWLLCHRGRVGDRQEGGA